MATYNKTDIAHLKWKLIEKDKLSVIEAEKRIEELLFWMKKSKLRKTKLKNGGQ